MSSIKSHPVGLAQDQHSGAQSAPDLEGWPGVRALAGPQYALFTAAQAAALGVTASAVRSREQTGVVERWSPHVLAFAGAPKSYRQRCMAAVLDAGDGAMVAGRAAASLWRLPGFPFGPISVLVPGSHRPCSALGVVRRSDLFTGRGVRLHDIPVLTPTAMLFDIAGRVRLGLLERSVDTAWAEGLTDGARLHLFSEIFLACGRRGTADMRAILATRGPDWTPPASRLEAQFNRVIVRGNMPEPRRQVWLGDADSRIGRVDARDPVVPLVGEINSDRYHVAPLDVAADAARRQRLEEAGFEVIEFPEFEVWHRPKLVEYRWRVARNRLLAA